MQGFGRLALEDYISYGLNTRSLTADKVSVNPVAVLLGADLTLVDESGNKYTFTLEESIVIDEAINDADYIFPDWIKNCDDLLSYTDAILE